MVGLAGHARLFCKRSVASLDREDKPRGDGPCFVLPYARFGARDYDPVTGRWTARDPILFGGGQANLYAYVNNDPVNFIDPTGLVFLEYDVGSGTLTVDPENGSAPYAIPGTSGKGPFTNNPGASGHPWQGPIPAGQYEIEGAALTRFGVLGALGRLLTGRGDWGSFRTQITPYPGTDTRGRGGFFMHGGAFEGSAGCIDVGGGFSGNANTNRLIADILGDPDGLVQLLVH